MSDSARPDVRATVLVVVFALTLWLGYAALTGAPVVRIHNRSAAVLEEVRLEGAGVAVFVPNLAAGESSEIIVHPNGESGLIFSFLSGGKTPQKDLGYFEPSGGYCVDVTVAPDASITSDVSTLCLRLRRVTE